MERLITGSSYKQYLKLIGTHIKAYHTNVSYPNEDGSESTEGLPSLQALYGIYDSLLTAHKTLCSYFGDISNPTASTACTSIPRGFTIAIDNNNSIVEYQYKKVRPNNGYTMYDLEIKASTGGGPTPSDIDADDVSYNPSSTYIDGTIGDAMKEAESNIQNNSTSISDINSSIGNLSNLHTEHKGSLVEAINEAVDNEGSSITVVDNLDSTSNEDALSANQGRVLKGIADSKVSGIQVTGESNPRYPVNGIVTIPAEGGSGDITGATLGGATVPVSNKVLQFEAYPTANTMQYSSAINYNSGTIGKEVKDLNISINDLSTQVAELDKPSPTPSPSTTVVNLANYTTSGSSLTYDVDNKYIYNTKDTTFYQYSEENNDTTVYYGVFKVIGEDRYLMYSITNNTTFTYTGNYTELTLPANAKKEFALGSLAAVKRVNGEGESWKNTTINLFCTKQNMALRNRCKNVTLNGVTAWRVLIKSEDGNTIYVYKANQDGNYYWESNVARSSIADFNMLDNYFDEKQIAVYSENSTIANPTQNIFYNLMGSGSTPTTITSLDISSISVTNPNEVTILFKTDATEPCSIAALTTQRILGPVSLAKGQVYVMSILRGIVCIVEAPLYVVPQEEEQEEE